jgi:hypothetical protein
MKAISFVLAISLSMPVFGQTGVIASGNVARKDFNFYWQCRLEPPSPPIADQLGYASGVNPDHDTIYRVMIDRAHRTYFGYEVRIQPLAQTGVYRVNFQPLDLGAQALAQIHIDDPGKWKKLEIGPAAARPLYPFRESPDTVHSMDVLAVDLLVNQVTNQKIVDYVAIQEPGRSWTFEIPVKREFAYNPGTPRDFSVDDAAMRLVEPRLSINGKPEASRSGEFAGASPWVYVQGRGRFLLSLVPHPELGYRKTGEVRGTSLSFALGADTFTVNSASRIASGDAPFNLYVLLEPGWKPAYANAASVIFGDQK